MDESFTNAVYEFKLKNKWGHEGRMCYSSRNVFEKAVTNFLIEVGKSRMEATGALYELVNAGWYQVDSDTLIEVDRIPLGLEDDHPAMRKR